MRNLTKALVLLLITVKSFSIPAKPTPTKIVQPDGNSIMIQGYGDERYSLTETTDGYVIIRKTDGWWVYAELGAGGNFVPTEIKVASPEIREVKEANFLMSVKKHLREIVKSESGIIQVKKDNTYYYKDNILKNMAVDKFSISNHLKIKKISSKTINCLILCVKFSDLTSKYAAQSFQQMINDNNWNSIGGVSKYYNDVTNGMFTMNADFQEWITATHPSSYYAKSNANYDTHVDELVKQAVDAAAANGVNFSKYDNDGDGYVDALFVVHSGLGAEEGSQNQYIWSHAGSITEVTYNGVKISGYSIEPEIGGSEHIGIGVFCHEFGHQLGLPDLYDTDDNANSNGLGNYCLMADGPWGGNGNNTSRPSSLCAWGKEWLGCATPTVISSNQKISIQTTANPFQISKIWLDQYQNYEYLLIENRQKVNWDLDLPSSGFYIYHIDRSLSEIYPAANSINTQSAHLGVKLLQADGKNDLDLMVNRGDAGDPFPGSTGNVNISDNTNPNTKMWDGTSTSVSISNIGNSSNTMTADISVNSYYETYPSKYFSKTSTWTWGWSTSNIAFGLTKFLPSSDGKLKAVRIYANNNYSNLTVNIYSSFSGTSGSKPSNLLASSQITNMPYTAFYTAAFSQDIDVQNNIPIYVEIKYTKLSGGYPIPISDYLSGSGNCYQSKDGTSYISMNANVMVEALFIKSTTQQYTISGNIKYQTANFSGVTLTLSGSSSSSTTSDASGNYSFIVSAGGTYILTPSKSGYSFSPISQTFSNISSNQTQNFTAAQTTTTISGSILYNGAGLSGVTLSLSGSSSSSTTSDANGNYSFTVNSGGTYTITPSKSGYSFTPINQTFSNLISNQMQTFTAVLNTATISGSITYNGTGLSGVTIVLSGSSTSSTTSDAGGNYSFTVNSGGTYTITPNKSGYTFTPTNQIFTNIISSQKQNFIASQIIINVNISGTITEGGKAKSGVSVSCPNAQTTSYNTGLDGKYSFLVNSGDTYTITPTLSGYQFTPENYTFTGITSNATKDFTADLIIDIPDSNFKTLIREATNKPTGNLTSSDLSIITNINAPNRKIKSIFGMNYMTNVTTAVFSNNQISDLSALSSLGKLTSLKLDNNLILDLTPIKDLQNLKDLDVSDNKITNMNIISNITKLTSLIFVNTSQRDVSFLSSLTGLNYLNLDSNQISDLSPISKLTNITDLKISNNQLDENDLQNLYALKFLNNNSWGGYLDLRGNLGFTQSAIQALAIQLPLIKYQNILWDKIIKAPEKFSLNQPKNNDEIKLSYPSTAVIFVWNRSIDPNGDPVSYSIRIYNPPFERSIDKLSDTVLTIKFDNLSKSSTYQWYIIASNGSFSTTSDTLSFKTSSTISSIKNSNQFFVPNYELKQNYPNPFNPSTLISFQLPVAGFTILKVYDISGKELVTLVNDFLTSGEHIVKFDAANIPSGIYYYKLTCTGFINTKKFILIK